MPCALAEYYMNSFLRGYSTVDKHGRVFRARLANFIRTISVGLEWRSAETTSRQKVEKPKLTVSSARVTLRMQWPMKDFLLV